VAGRLGARDPGLAGRRVLEAVRFTTRKFLDDGCMDSAASISFHVLLSLFPLIILITLVSSRLVLQSPGRQRDVITAVVDQLPLSTAGRGDVEHLVTSAAASSEGFGIVSAIGLVWAASGVMASLRTALNRAWEVDAPRPIVRGKLYDVALIGAAGAVFLAVTGLVVLSHLPIVGSRVAASLAGAVLPAVGVFAGSLFLYRVVPARRPRLRSAALGAAVCATAFTVLEHGFAVYVTHLSNFNHVYGSLAAPVALLFFVYLAAMTMLWCAELASWSERRASGPTGQGS
jgi:membrane protein